MTLRSDWLVHNQEETGGRVRPRMFCFPFAGGGASICRTWGRALGSAVALYAVQLPGREERIREPRYYSVKSLCDAMFEAGEDGGWFDAPCIIYGHSMGAKIAFETARRLEEQGRPPLLLIVSGSRAPSTPPARLVSTYPDRDFDNELRHLSGTPEAILRDPDFMRLLRPLLRADFAVDESYVTTQRLSVPMRAFSGMEDSEVTAPELEKWREHTSAGFDARMLPGDHFFLKKNESLYLPILKELVEKAVEKTL